MLIGATIFDMKNREVHDYWWIIFGVIASGMFLLQINNLDFLNTLILSMVFLVPISLALWYFGLFGGADAFALIVLSALAPLATLFDQQVSPITIFVNASLVALIPIGFNALTNLKKILNQENIFEGFDESRVKKIIACFLGTKQKSPKYSFSIEKRTNDFREFDFSIHHAEKSDFCTRQNSWVSPGLPFMLYITFGFVLQLIFGDVLFSFLL